MLKCVTSHYVRYGTCLYNRLKNKLKNYKGNKGHCCVLPVHLMMDQPLDSTSFHILTILASILNYPVLLHTIYNLSIVPRHPVHQNSNLSTTVHCPMFSNPKLNIIPLQLALSHRTILPMW